MKILLTGATGYLGSRLCRALADAGHDVIALCRSRQSVAVVSIDVPHVERVSLSDCTLREVFEREHPDGVIHTATTYGRGQEQLECIIATNELFPAEIISLCGRFKTGFFLNTDSILPRNINAYAISKGHVLDWMTLYADHVKMINLRLDHFYGPFDRPPKFVALMLEKMRRNDSEIDLTAGMQTRDFVYIDDVVCAYMMVLGKIDSMPLGKVSMFEVGTNVRTSIRELVTKIRKVTGSSAKLNFGAVPLRKNEVLDYEVDTAALRNLGWSPRVTLDEGLKTIIEMEKVK